MVLALSGLVILFYFEKHAHHFTLNNHHSLDQRSLQIVSSLKGQDAVKFQIFIDENSVIAQKIHQFFKPFVMHNDELLLEFVDPIVEPDKAQLNNITMQGEMVLSYLDDNRLERINITELSESAVVNAVLRLKNSNDEWLIFAEGYGMQKIDDESPQGMSELLIYLKKIGIKVARMPLNPLLQLPENVKVIVLPVPTKTIDEQMVEWLKVQHQRGISLWWINDVNAVDQTSMELAFDVINGEKAALYDDVYTDAMTVFPSHPITENFNQPIYIAQAREVLLDGSQTLWQSSIGVVLAASKEQGDQRFLITGDGDFVSNQYFKAAANRSFAERVVDWLFFHDDRVNLAVKVNDNTQLFLSRPQLLFLSVFLLILWPLFFIIMAWKQFRSGH